MTRAAPNNVTVGGRYYYVTETVLGLPEVPFKVLLFQVTGK